MKFLLSSSPAASHRASAGQKPAQKKKAVLSPQYPCGTHSSSTREVHAPLQFGLAVRCHGHEAANGIQHTSVCGAVSLLGCRVDKLLQESVITGKCIKRTGMGK